MFSFYGILLIFSMLNTPVSSDPVWFSRQKRINLALIGRENGTSNTVRNQECLEKRGNTYDL